jgi:hypothetical protein
LQQIADDVAGAALYSLLAVAADPGASLPEDSIEYSFRQDVLASVPQSRRKEIAETASALISMPIEGRVALFGRAGRRMPKDHLANGGMENYEDGAPPLKLDPKFLGRDDKITLRVSPGNLRRENDRLSMPLPRGAEQERLSAIGQDMEATDEGVFDEDRILAKFQLPQGIPAQSHVPTLDQFTAELPPLKHNAVSFRLRKIHCLDQTNGWLGGETLADKIEWAAILNGSKGETVNTGKQWAGKFRDGDAFTFIPPRTLATFRADVGTWPWHANILLMLSERDAGGFADFISKVYEKIKTDIEKKVAQWVAAGLQQYIGKFLAAIIGGLVGSAVVWVIGWLIKIIKDDIFTPCVRGVWIQSQKALYHASNVLDGFTSPTWVCDYKQHGGHYRLMWDVQLKGQVE